jgi:xanthine dehydrogenase accessory factor
MVCGGDSHLKFTYRTNDEKSKKIIADLKEKYKNNHTVYIFGAGHVSMELAKTLSHLDFDVVVWDDRISFANDERFPDAKRVICKPMENVLNEIDITENDFVVVMTRGHVFDYLVEKQVLESKAAYIGVIGSSNKNKVLREKLLADGFSEERVRNVCAPIGIAIAAETPEEIAISIASELILFRSRLEKRRKAMN